MPYHRLFSVSVLEVSSVGSGVVQTFPATGKSGFGPTEGMCQCVTLHSLLDASWSKMRVQILTVQRQGPHSSSLGWASNEDDTFSD